MKNSLFVIGIGISLLVSQALAAPQYKAKSKTSSASPVSQPVYVPLPTPVPTPIPVVSKPLPAKVSRPIQKPKLVDEGDIEFVESPWMLFLGVDLGFSNYSAYNNSATEAARSGFHGGVRALVAYSWDTWVVDGGLGWQLITNSGTNADGSKNTDRSQVPYFDLSPRYRFKNNFQVGPEFQYWLSTDKGLNPTLPNRDTISDASNTSSWLGIQGVYEWPAQESSNLYRLGARVLHGMSVSGRNVNVFQAFFQIGFDAFNASEDESQNKRHIEQVNETDLNQAELNTPVAPIQMAIPEPSPSELNPDPIVLSTPVPPEPEATPEELNPAPPISEKGQEVKKPNKLVLTLDMNDLPFGFNNANLPKANAARLKNMGAYLAKHNTAWKKVIVSGHTDERGTHSYNAKLSEKRAQVVKQYLVEGGASTSKIKTVGLGETKPRDKRHNEKAWARNRRVELEFEGVKDSVILKKSLNQ